MLPREKSFSFFMSVSVIGMYACETEKDEEFEEDAFSIIKRNVLFIMIRKM